MRREPENLNEVCIVVQQAALPLHFLVLFFFVVPRLIGITCRSGWRPMMLRRLPFWVVNSLTITSSVARSSRLLVHLLVLAAFMPFAAVAFGKLSDESLARIPTAGIDFDIHNGQLLAPILIPRVPGTSGSQAVQQHFVRFFREQLPAWEVEWHNSTAKTPATGEQLIPFTNLIFRRDPPWAAPGDVARLTLAAHYDTLYQPEGFIGATDSAASCAMLMHVARSIDAALTAKWEAIKASGEAGSGLDEERGVQILLLDGEEAWVKWSATDSLYGSR